MPHARAQVGLEGFFPFFSDKGGWHALIFIFTKLLLFKNW